MNDSQTQKWQRQICALFIEELKKIRNGGLDKNGVNSIWQRPWQLVRQKSLLTEKSYQGVNQLILTLVCQVKGYDDWRWLTYNQLISHNKTCKPVEKWHIPKEKITMDGGHLFAVRYLLIRYRLNNQGKFLTLAQKNQLISQSGGKLKEFDFVVSKTVGYHRVYNASIVAGIQKNSRGAGDFENEVAAKVVADFLTNEKLVVEHRAQNKAFYDYANDKIILPLKSSFKNEASYYDVLLHEISHATGAKRRLNRIVDFKTQSKSAYALEELVAELAGVLLRSHLKITVENNEADYHNNIAYLDSWIISLQKSPEILWEVLEQAVGAYEYFVQNSLNGEDSILKSETLCQLDKKNA